MNAGPLPISTPKVAAHFALRIIGIRPKPAKQMMELLDEDAQNPTLGIGR
jgi:hypothetical protein